MELPEFDMERLLVAWQDAVFELYLAEEKIEPEVVENMRSWPHSGFSVDQSVFLPAGDQAGIERLIQYMTRCPFSLSQSQGACQVLRRLWGVQFWRGSPDVGLTGTICQ